jgi:hypothetical protein
LPPAWSLPNFWATAHGKEHGVPLLEPVGPADLPLDPADLRQSARQR